MLGEWISWDFLDTHIPTPTADPSKNIDLTAFRPQLGTACVRRTLHRPMLPRKRLSSTLV